MIEIPADRLHALYAHARATFPAECCGYLAGPMLEVVRCTNAQATGANPLAPARGAETGFVIAGGELLAFARSFATDRPARVVYHSHTNGRAYFSELDQTLAAGPAYPVEHLVIGVTAAGVRECAQHAWSADARAYVEISRWSVEMLPLTP